MLGMTAPKGVTTRYTNVSVFNQAFYLIDSVASVLFTVDCTLPCMTCPINSPTYCLTCYNDPLITPAVYYDSINHNCYQTCLDGYYKVETPNKLCSPCSSSCLTCTTSSTNCLTCDKTSTNKYLYTDPATTTKSCLSGCPSGYYPDNTQFLCKPCETPCATCTSPTLCLSCIPGPGSGYRFWAKDFSCLFTCPADISIDNGVVCQPCNSVCKTCRDEVTKCIECADDAAFYQNTCLAVCPDNMVISSKTCGACSLVCKTCSIRATNCTSCDPTSTIPLLQKNPDNTESSCVSNCLPKYYNTSATGSCLLCSDYISQTHC